MKKIIILLFITICTPLAAQVDDPNNSIFNRSNSTPAGGAIGAVLGSFASPPAGINGGSPVGLENNGSGDLLVTEIDNDEYFTQSTAGGLVSGPVSIVANSNQPIGISIDNTFIYVTDPSTTDVDRYDLSGNYVSSFSVSTETTFPEGITYAAPFNNLFVVDGAGGNKVSEYDLSGSLLNNYPINGSSQDGIAFDYQRCVFWIYDSGTDLVRSYDSSFSEIENFPGTGAAGFSSGEGVAVINDSLFVVAVTSAQIVEFDISQAQPAANAATLCPQGPVNVPMVPANNHFALLALSLTLALFGGLFIRKRYN